jgi:Flp pilus assembly protein TadD
MTLITHQDWIVKVMNIQDFYLPLLLDALFFISVGVFGYFIFKTSKKTFKIYVLFCLWFIIGFLLHIQIIPLDFTVADRWFYFPLVGLLGLIGLVIQHLRIPQKVLLIIGISILLVLSIRTIVRNENWRTGDTLYSHDLNLAQDNTYLNGLLGNALLDQGQYDASIIYFNKAMQLNPTASINDINLSAAYYMKGDLKNTEKYLIEAISKEHTQMAYERLSMLYLKNNNFPQAKKVLKEGILRYSKDQTLYLYLAYSEYNLNNRDAALVIAQKAYELSPNTQSQYVLNQITNNEKIIFQ